MQNYTLGDILAEALAEKPRNEPLLCDVRYTVHVWADLVKYPNKKITMIKFLRDASGITLKDAKNTVESTEGFLIPRVIWNAMSNNISFSGEPLDLFTEKRSLRSEMQSGSHLLLKKPLLANRLARGALQTLTP